MPTPTPTPSEIVRVVEIMGENDYPLVKGLIYAGDEDESNAKWKDTLDDIDEWNSKVRGKYAQLAGKVNLKPSDRMYAIRARVRLRYGLTEQIDSSVTGETLGSYAVPVEYRF